MSDQENSKTLVIPVKGMHCATCALSISNNLYKKEGIKKADVNYGTEKAVVEYDPDKISLEEIGETIRELEYEPVMPGEGEVREVTMRILGMTCAACVAAVEKALEHVPGVAKIVLEAFEAWPPDGSRKELHYLPGHEIGIERRPFREILEDFPKELVDEGVGKRKPKVGADGMVAGNLHGYPTLHPAALDHNDFLIQRRRERYFDYFR